jgi:succinoglycan biosynthesis protein ExoM
MTTPQPGMNRKRDHIAVCICTYKRPELLAHLLHHLRGQKTEGLFTFSVVIVDNDAEQTAKGVVEKFKDNRDLALEYHVEREKGYSNARNTAVHHAGGNLLAFIDDDEYPDESWLLSLYKVQKAYNADGVLGPVNPYFESKPPGWVVKGRLCERESFPTGTVLQNTKYTRTGNVLLEMTLFNDREPFDPRFGKTGGEDTDFFLRMIRQGKRFIWCDEAPVWELVPPERLKRGYFIKRALLRGFYHSRGKSAISVTALKSFAAVLLYSAALPFCLMAGQHVFMNYLIRNCDHIGKLMGIMGVAPIEERTF